MTRRNKAYTAALDRYYAQLEQAIAAGDQEWAAFCRVRIDRFAKKIEG